MDSNVVWNAPRNGFRKGMSLQELREYEEPNATPTARSIRNSNLIKAALQRIANKTPVGTKWKKTFKKTSKPATRVVLPKITKPATFQIKKNRKAQLARLAKMNKNERIAAAKYARQQWLLRNRAARIALAKEKQAYWNLYRKFVAFQKLPLAERKRRQAYAKVNARNKILGIGPVASDATWKPAKNGQFYYK